VEVARAQSPNHDRAFGISWNKVVDKRVFLIYLFPIFIKALRKTAVSLNL
jgi:hypothetical protein